MCTEHIQWPFPIREEGLNHLAHKLQPHEAVAIICDHDALRRLRSSYRMMLDFYGVVLVDEITGAVERSQDYEERFRNLGTRILKCLGELGHEHYQWPLIEFFMHEVFRTRALLPCRTSLLEFWAPSLRSAVQRDNGEL